MKNKKIGVTSLIAILVLGATLFGISANADAEVRKAICSDLDIRNVEISAWSLAPEKYNSTLTEVSRTRAMLELALSDANKVPSKFMAFGSSGVLKQLKNGRHLSIRLSDELNAFASSVYKSSLGLRRTSLVNQLSDLKARQKAYEDVESPMFWSLNFGNPKAVFVNPYDLKVLSLETKIEALNYELNGKVKDYLLNRRSLTEDASLLAQNLVDLENCR